MSGVAAGAKAGAGARLVEPKPAGDLVALGAWRERRTEPGKKLFFQDVPNPDFIYLLLHSSAGRRCRRATLGPSAS